MGNEFRRVVDTFRGFAGTALPEGSLEDQRRNFDAEDEDLLTGLASNDLRGFPRSLCFDRCFAGFLDELC